MDKLHANDLKTSTLKARKQFSYNSSQYCVGLEQDKRALNHWTPFAPPFSNALVHFMYRGARLSISMFFSHFIEQKYKIFPSVFTYIVPVAGSITLLQNEHLVMSFLCRFPCQAVLPQFLFREASRYRLFESDP